MADPTTMTDAELLACISDAEHAASVLARLNAEWTRRHRAGHCPTDCREPMAGPEHFGQPSPADEPRFDHLPEGTTATCRYCRRRVLLDQREGGGPGKDWGDGPADWVGNGGRGMDYGCGNHPLSDSDGTWGHIPDPSTIAAPARCCLTGCTEPTEGPSEGEACEYHGDLIAAHHNGEHVTSWAECPVCDR